MNSHRARSGRWWKSSTDGGHAIPGGVGKSNHISGSVIKSFMVQKRYQKAGPSLYARIELSYPHRNLAWIPHGGAIGTPSGLNVTPKRSSSMRRRGGSRSGPGAPAGHIWTSETSRHEHLNSPSNENRYLTSLSIIFFPFFQYLTDQHRHRKLFFRRSLRDPIRKRDRYDRRKRAICGAFQLFSSCPGTRTAVCGSSGHKIPF